MGFQKIDATLRVGKKYYFVRTERSTFIFLCRKSFVRAEQFVLG